MGALKAGRPHQFTGRLDPVDAASRAEGLTAREAAARLDRDGPNVLPTARTPHPLRLLLGQLTHFFALMLWVAVLLALIAGLPQLSVAIAVIIILNGIFAFVQEYRASKTAERLQELLPLNSTVIRDGRQQVVSADRLVVDDVVLLEPGDRICADGMLIHADGLAVDESLLTGESERVRPEEGASIFAGTFVTEGSARFRVTATGIRTRLAAIASLSRGGRRPPSPLALRLGRVVRIVATLAVLTGSAFFAIALLLGTPAQDGFLFAIGVTVALVPEGLLPTVTLSLALGARRMSERNALVRSLDSVETLGSTTYLCTDKTGTLTCNEMAVVEVWTPTGTYTIEANGYDASRRLAGTPEAVALVAQVAAQASTGRVGLHDGRWIPRGDPMESALHVLALRTGTPPGAVDRAVARRMPFDARRRRMSAVVGGHLVVKGAVEAVVARCINVDPEAIRSAASSANRGLRVIAVARRTTRDGDLTSHADTVETDLQLLGIVALEDPPREGASEAIDALRRAGITIAMVTGDHPVTARAIASEVGLLLPGAPVVEASALPCDQGALGEFLENDGTVIARATPEDKLRIAEALQSRGHIVAMTGDGVNDGPALSRANIGVALGRSGTDVARETADLVLLDDHLATIVVAVEVGRTTFMNVRKFLTYHLTDNVAELTPFVLWALSGGSYPLALSVLQVLALDIGTDLLPAIALGAEPPTSGVLDGPMRTQALIDRRLMARAFGVLGPAEALGEMTAFTLVLLAGGWAWGLDPSPGLLSAASGAAFTAVVLGQLANAFACRSATRWVGMQRLTANRLLLMAVGIEVLLLLFFVGFPPMQNLLGGAWPDPLGWWLALATAPLVIAADTLHKAMRARRTRTVRAVGEPAVPSPHGPTGP